MKKLLTVLFVLLALIFVYILYIFQTTGFFKKVGHEFNGELVSNISIKGAEDITVIHKDSLAIISATNRDVYPPTRTEEGNLYLFKFSEKTFEYQPLTKDLKFEFAPHGISTFKKDSTLVIAAINHTSMGHSIEFFELTDTLEHFKTLRDKSMISPNDLVLLDKERFYFTNDHGFLTGFKRLLEEYLGFAWSNVVYYNGNNFAPVADGIAYANGINLDAKRQLLYVASPRKFLIKVYQVEEDNKLTHIDNIDCNTGVDNIELDQNGHLWVGAHPNLLAFAAYAKGSKDISPSEIIKIKYRGKQDYSLDQIYLDDGSQMSGCSVAAPFGQHLLVGNVKDDHLMVLKMQNE